MSHNSVLMWEKYLCQVSALPKLTANQTAPLVSRRLRCRSLSASLRGQAKSSTPEPLLPLCPDVSGLTEHDGLVKPLASCQGVLLPLNSREAAIATGQQGHLVWVVSVKNRPTFEMTISQQIWQCLLVAALIGACKRSFWFLRAALGNWLIIQTLYPNKQAMLRTY